MTGHKLTRVALLVTVLGVAGCGSEVTTDTTEPTPATEAELEAFCDKLDEVEDLDYQSRYEALAEVAPAEIRAALIRAASNPGPTDDDKRIEEYLERCEA